MTERYLVLEASVVEPAYTKTQFDANVLEPDAKLDEYREVRAALGQEDDGVDRGPRPGVLIRP